MPNADDFGIVAVEAMAAGTPVIAFGKGGSLDYVIPNKTGLLFEKQTVKSLSTALETAMTKNFNNEAIVDHAKLFSVEEFKKKMRDYIKQCLSDQKET